METRKLGRGQMVQRQMSIVFHLQASETDVLCEIFGKKKRFSQGKELREGMQAVEKKGRMNAVGLAHPSL